MSSAMTLLKNRVKMTVIKMKGLIIMNLNETFNNYIKRVVFQTEY